MFTCANLATRQQKYKQKNTSSDYYLIINLNIIKLSFAPGNMILHLNILHDNMFVF